MTSIQTEQRNLKEKNIPFMSEGDKRVIDEFKDQQESITNISGTEGFKSIRKYWLRKEMEAIEKLSKTDPENKYEVAKQQARFNIAKEFNMFLNGVLK